jgi:hypothetical protein
MVVHTSKPSDAGGIGKKIKIKITLGKKCETLSKK